MLDDDEEEVLLVSICSKQNSFPWAKEWEECLSFLISWKRGKKVFWLSCSFSPLILLRRRNMRLRSRRRRRFRLSMYGHIHTGLCMQFLALAYKVRTQRQENDFFLVSLLTFFLSLLLFRRRRFFITISFIRKWEKSWRGQRDEKNLLSSHSPPILIKLEMRFFFHPFLFAVRVSFLRERRELG